MIPFSTWSQARQDSSEQSEPTDFGSQEMVLSGEIEAELAGLMDELVQNIVTSSIVQLRAALEAVGMSWAEHQANEHKRFVRQEISKVEEKITSAVVDALVPILSELQLRQIMTEFATTLQKLLPEFETQHLVIQAPKDVHELLQLALNRQAVNADIETIENRQVKIAGTQVVLTANLDSWGEKLRELVTP